MREILFKGKRTTADEWVEGDFLKRKNGTFIVHRKTDMAVPVIPGTVSQYTGKKDIHGNKIFENDIAVLTFVDSTGCAQQIIVKIDLSVLGLGFENEYEHFFRTMGLFPVDTEEQIEIIGNIFDNPDLMEGGDDDE